MSRRSTCSQPSSDASQSGETSRKRKHKDLTLTEKWAILVRYYRYWQPHNERLVHKGMETLKRELELGEQTIRDVVDQYCEATRDGNMFPDLSPKKSGRVGPKSKLTEELAAKIVEFNSEEGKDLSVEEFTRCFNLRYGTDIPRGTMYRYIVRLNAKLVRSHVKPPLPPKHKKERQRVASNPARDDTADAEQALP